MHVGSRKLKVIKHVMKYRQSKTLLMLSLCSCQHVLNLCIPSRKLQYF